LHLPQELWKFLKEGYVSTTILTGNTGVDALQQIREKLKNFKLERNQLEDLLGFSLSEEYVYSLNIEESPSDLVKNQFFQQLKN
jgi:predicted metalloenzyme YecM